MIQKPVIPGQTPYNASTLGPAVEEAIRQGKFYVAPPLRMTRDTAGTTISLDLANVDESIPPVLATVTPNASGKCAWTEVIPDGANGFIPKPDGRTGSAPLTFAQTTVVNPPAGPHWLYPGYKDESAGIQLYYFFLCAETGPELPQPGLRPGIPGLRYLQLQPCPPPLYEVSSGGSIGWSGGIGSPLQCPRIESPTLTAYLYDRPGDYYSTFPPPDNPEDGGTLVTFGTITRSDLPQISAGRSGLVDQTLINQASHPVIANNGVGVGPEVYYNGAVEETGIWWRGVITSGNIKLTVEICESRICEIYYYNINATMSTFGPQDPVIPWLNRQVVFAGNTRGWFGLIGQVGVSSGAVRVTCNPPKIVVSAQGLSATIVADGVRAAYPYYLVIRS